TGRSSTERPRWSPTIDRNVGSSSARACATKRRTSRLPYRCRSFSSGPPSTGGTGPYAAKPTTLTAATLDACVCDGLPISLWSRAGLLGMTDTVAVRTFTLGEGDGVITYDVRGDVADATTDRPALFILGSPMEAAYFAPLAEHFSDRPVITYDPRGAARNPHGTSLITPEQHAEDIH